MNSANAATAAPAVPASTAANLLVETNLAGAAPTAPSLNPLRKANSTEPSRSDRKEDRTFARSSVTDAQAESQTVSLKSGEFQPTMRTGDVSPAAIVIGHNSVLDKTAVATTLVGPDQAGGQTLHASPGGQGMGDAKAPTTSPFPTSDAADTPASPVLQSARVLDRIGQSEIRVGLNTADFGNLELHTRVSQDRVAATLATSHSELRAALAAEMPSLEHAMVQHQLTLDSFHLDTHSGAQQNKNHGALADSQNRSQTWEQAAVDRGAAADGLPAPETVLPQIWIHPYSSGLNVHA